MPGFAGEALTTGRLALARGVIWSAWFLTLMSMRLLLRRDNPFRIYVDGAYEEVRPIHLRALGARPKGPRISTVRGWKIVAGSIAGAALVVPERKTMSFLFNLVATIDLF